MAATKHPPESATGIELPRQKNNQKLYLIREHGGNGWRCPGMTPITYIKQILMVIDANTMRGRLK